MSGIPFDEPREQSLVKATIVSKYFWAWAKVIMPWAKQKKIDIAYLDLFCGPGYYEDGTKSTPLLILEKAIRDPDMCNMLITYFNDANSAYITSLQSAVQNLPGIQTLRHQPQFSTSTIDDTVAQAFKEIRMVPTLVFLDPFGYKGLSIELIESLLKDWGCECIMFFNYNRINMGLSNQEVEHLMDSLFGQARAVSLRASLDAISPSQRELTIVEEISQAIKGRGVRYVLPFRFKNDTGNRTSHYLIFMSKSHVGYEIMKKVMAAESSNRDEGIASFEYCAADGRQPLLFSLSQPLYTLETALLDDFAGQTMTMRQVFDIHNIDTPYIEKNYKDALRSLETQGHIAANPSAIKRRRGTFGDNVRVTFPRKE